MIKLNWTIKHLKTKEDIINIINHYLKIKPDYSGMDTETTGLHIILDRPFVVTFGLANYTTKEAIAFSYDLTAKPELNDLFFKNMYLVLGKTKKCLFWNAKYDMHMVFNIGYAYPHSNMSDAGIYARLAHDAVAQSKGGMPTKLKPYATRYIDRRASQYEKLVKAESTKLVKIRTNKLKEAGFKIGQIDEFLKDKLNEVTDLPEEVQKIFNECLDPDNYMNIDRGILLTYACYDVIYTVEAHYQCLPIVTHKEQMKVVEREEALIPVLFKMERVGFKLNKPYVLQTKERMKQYILNKRKELCDLFNQEVKVGQHALIKELYFNKFGITLDGSSEDDLKDLYHNSNPVVSKTAKLIVELRTLEKWYSTYIIKWIKHINELDRIYTTIKQYHPVSGRVSSDFQQFPKEAIKDDEGNELFNPRKLVLAHGGDYPSIAYLDYSQIELRIQAIYTVFVMGGDTNLCRVFMPFKCHLKNGTKFNYKNKEHLDNALKWEWYLDEDESKRWKKTDMHSLTASKAFPDIDPESEDFENHYRKIGKSTNFACNYNANASTLERQFGFSRELAETLYKAYSESFPGVKEYREYVKQFLYTKPYAENLFGRRYYGASYHEVSNYLIQGSSADFLKIKMIEIDNFLVSNDYKTKFQMNIHDELSFEIYQGEEHILKEIKRIMEDLPGTVVPIVADLELTTTTWAEKKKYEVA